MRRNKVIEALDSANEHLTVDEIFELARKLDPKIGYTTVWRTLKLLESRGIAAAQKFHDGLTRYEKITPKTHHDHMICTKCGAVEEFYDPSVEKTQKKLADLHKFELISHKMELYGYCKRCKK